MRFAVCAALLTAVAAAQTADEWIIDTVAGVGVGDGGPATAAYLSSPGGMAIDSTGNLYIADSNNRRIRKVDVDGNISTVAGGGSPNSGLGDGGPATAAYLRYPRSVAIDSAGNIYIADAGDNRIRKIDTDGNIFTIAGTGTLGFSGDGGPAVQAHLNLPQGIALDAAGNLYIADIRNHRIRKIDTDGNIFTIAGTGTPGFSGDGGPATAAQLIGPSGVAVDATGNIYIADRNTQQIRKVGIDGNISTVAGGGNPNSGIGDGGPATAAQLSGPSSVAVDAAGNIYIADTFNNRIRKVDVGGNILTIAGTGTSGLSGDGGPATAAELHWPRNVAVDARGNLYIADNDNHRIRKVSTTGTISTAAGKGNIGDGAAATAARLTPSDAVLNSQGNLYIADTFNHRIRRVDVDGNIATVAGTGTKGYNYDGGPATEARLDYPRGVAIDSVGNLYIADTSNNCIRKVDVDGNISTVAGAEDIGYLLRSGSGCRPGLGGDGVPAIAAELNWPSNVAVDAEGNLYIADTFNHRIRKVDVDGNISTVAGAGASAGGIGMSGYSGDGGPAVQAHLNRPGSVAVDAEGNLYIADTFNHRIRAVDIDGDIFTIAGTGTPGFSGDSGPATAAQLNFPSGVAVDAAGNIYIADGSNDRIRRLTPAPPRGPPISSGGIVLATGLPVVNSISPNAIISVFGREFLPDGTQAASPALDGAGRVATNLAGVCLEIDGKRAPLFAVFPNQINAQAPHDLTLGQAQVAAIGGCGAEDELRGLAATVEVASVSPAFFSFPLNSSGRNPAAALHGNGPALVGSRGSIPGVDIYPAAPGEVITLFGTGFGPTEPPLETGQIPGIAAEIASDVEIAFGGITLLSEHILYAGAAPCCAGLYQFAVRVPRGLPEGRIPVTAAVQGVSTPQGPFLAVLWPETAAPADRGQ